MINRSPEVIYYSPDNGQACGIKGYLPGKPVEYVRADTVISRKPTAVSKIPRREG